MNKPKLEVFAGPCVIEDEVMILETAARLQEEFNRFNAKVNFTFKASFDKANRTSLDSYRGPGLVKGLEILAKVKEKTGLPIVTDFHLPEQADVVAEVADVIQIPAFLCRQTDMIMAGANACKKYGKILKIKKGQFLSPGDAQNIVEKVRNILDLNSILLTERGTSFGYNNLVVDMTSFQIMKSFGVRTIHDATHCVQMPGGMGKTTGGKREFIRTIARAAIAAGADGIFMETHPNPEKALSDATTQLPISDVPEILDELLKIYEVV